MLENTTVALLNQVYHIADASYYHGAHICRLILICFNDIPIKTVPVIQQNERANKCTHLGGLGLLSMLAGHREAFGDFAHSAISVFKGIAVPVSRCRLSDERLRKTFNVVSLYAAMYKG